MNGHRLQDLLYRGSGSTARHAGQPTDAFRPRGPTEPLNRQNRFLKLSALFTSAKGGTERTNLFGDALWHGVFDASYTQPGDYLVTKGNSFFIASQKPLLPVLCVLTNRVISIRHPNMQTNYGSNAYGGYTSGGSAPLIEGWPASVLGETRTGSSGVDLPTDQAIPYWNILLPRVANVTISPGDMVVDDLQRTAVISGSELTDLGWRISAKMATT